MKVFERWTQINCARNVVAFIDYVIVFTGVQFESFRSHLIHYMNEKSFGISIYFLL